MKHSSTSVCLCLDSNSDDNLLKNIELFDRLSLSFNGRVLFIKDVIGDEICCWSFYGQGRKLAEVCCTSIFYATEKKQTKVRRSTDGGQTGALSFIWMQKSFTWLNSSCIGQSHTFKGTFLKLLTGDFFQIFNLTSICPS